MSKRAYVLEDDPDQLYMVMHRLEEAGCAEVIAATNAETAGRVFETGGDIYLLDMRGRAGEFTGDFDTDYNIGPSVRDHLLLIGVPESRIRLMSAGVSEADIAAATASQIDLSRFWSSPC